MDLLLRDRQDRNKLDNSAPREVIDKAWRRYVVQKDGPGRYSGPTPSVCSVICRPPFTGATCLPARAGDTPIRGANLLSDAEWEATRPIVCRTLGLPPTCLE
jgi:hypothetical protein